MSKIKTSMAKHHKNPGQINVFLEIWAGDGMSRPIWANAIAEAMSVETKYATSYSGNYYTLGNEAVQKACFHFTLDGDEWNDFEQEIVRLRKHVGFEDLGIVLTQGDHVFSIQVEEVEDEDTTGTDEGSTTEAEESTS